MKSENTVDSKNISIYVMATLRNISFQNLSELDGNCVNLNLTGLHKVKSEGPLNSQNLLVPIGVFVRSGTKHTRDII